MYFTLKTHPTSRLLQNFNFRERGEGARLPFVDELLLLESISAARQLNSNQRNRRNELTVK